MVFDRRNPPPPLGVATSPVNFVAVPGDRLFVNEPRSIDSTIACPPESETTSASAPFSISPLDAGSYMLVAFYDRRGHFLPTFSFRNQPLAGDVGGGYVDLSTMTGDAVDFAPRYLPISIGTPVPGDSSPIPDHQIDTNGFVADNVPVTLGRVIPFTRPYFHPDGSELTLDRQASDGNPSGNPLAVPVVTMPQDAQILAFPAKPSADAIAKYQSSFTSVKLSWGVPDPEVSTASLDPFGLQLPPLPSAGKGGLLVYSRGVGIPENAAVAALWPQIAFVKLADAPVQGTESPTLVFQGTPEETNVTGKPMKPMVVIQGLTLFDDALGKTLVGAVPTSPSTNVLRDHVTALVRPAAICLDPRRSDLGGLLVTPHLTGQSADSTESGQKPLFDPAAVMSQPLVRDLRQGCLPKGRYAMTLVYPTGQTWTVPNEAGTCAASEGTVLGLTTPTSCSIKKRPVLLSQGARAVLEIVSPTSDGITTCETFRVPAECLSL